MDPLDQRLTDAGEAWRRAQRPPVEVGGFALSPARRSWFRPLQAVVGIAAALAVVAGALVLAPRGPGSGLASPAPSPSALTPSIVPDEANRYGDGIPRTFDGQHVYRPAEVVKDPPQGEFVLGGWDAGPLPVRCPIQQPGGSDRCPAFEGVAQTRGGSSVLPMSLGDTPWAGGPAFLVRARAYPALACLSNPPGACPGPSVSLIDVLWSGDPATAELPSPYPSTRSAWWSGREDSYCTSPAAYRLHGTVTWMGPCMGVFFDQPTPITMAVGDRLDLHLFAQAPDGTPIYSVPGTTDGAIIDIAATADPATVTYLAKAPGTATLITFGQCIDVDPSAPTGIAGETNGPCPILQVTVVPAP